MTAQNPAIFIQASSHPAEDVRRALGLLLPYPGVLTPSDLAVTQNGTPNMSVNVAGGRVAIPGSEATYQGTYLAENRGTTNLTISAADPTNPRIDLVVAKVQDAGYSGATNAWSLAVVTGTPAGSPAAPAAPANSIVLARVAVAALATSIVNANITDYRFITAGQSVATAPGGWIICVSTNRPSSPFEGMTIYETDTDKVFTYDGTGWSEILKLGQWIDYTPTLTQLGTVTKTVNYARYRRIGRSIHVTVNLAVTGTGTTANPIFVSLPVNSTAVPTNGNTVGEFEAYDSSAGTIFAGFATTFGGSATSVQGRHYSGGGAGNGIGTGTAAFALANGDYVFIDIEYEAAAS